MSQDDIDLRKVYDIIFNETARLIVVEKYKVQIVAATLLAQALRLYKSSLTDEAFNKMMDHLPDSKDDIRPYDTFIPTDKKSIN